MATKKRTLKILNKESKPIDVEHFLNRVKVAKSTGDKFTLEIFKNLYERFPRVLKVVLKREGITF